jgi:hypothetical protein
MTNTDRSASAAQPDETGAVAQTSPSAPSVTVLVLVGAACAAVGLLPWIVTGMRLPIQNLWEGPPPTGGMPLALLPFSQYAVTLIVTLITSGSLLAGIVARVLRRRRLARVWPVLVGVALVHAVALVQTVLTVQPGMMDRTEATVYVAGLTAGSAVTIVLGLVVLLLVARAPVGVATVAVAAVAVPAAGWITGLIIPFGSVSMPNAVQAAAFAFFPWVPAVIVGVALVWCGLRPLARIVSWVLSLALLWVVPAIFTAVGSALGTRILASRPAEMLLYGIEVFRAAVGGEAAQGRSVLAALLIGLVGTLVQELRSRSRSRASSPSRAG